MNPVASVDPEAGRLPDGVEIRSLPVHPDQRGSLCELYRESDPGRLRPVQWNLIHSNAGVLRGLRVHLDNADSIVLVSGKAFLGMQDLRPGSPTEGVAALLPLSGERPAVVTVPSGIAHGFYFPEPSILLIGLTHAWEPSDEYGCWWLDPELAIPWPVTTAVLSDKDADRRSVGELRTLLSNWRPA